jgi:predicted nucleic acid-binding protein
MIVDTSVWIDFLNGHASTQARRLVSAIETNETVAIPGLVYTEILLGLTDTKEAKRIAGLLTAFQIVQEPNLGDYAAAANIYRVCRSHGITIRSTIDCIIAQLCLRDGIALLAKDRDFVAIAKHWPLRLVM